MSRVLFLRCGFHGIPLQYLIDVRFNNAAINRIEIDFRLVAFLVDGVDFIALAARLEDLDSR